MPRYQLQMTLVHASCLCPEVHLMLVHANKNWFNGVNFTFVHADQQEDILCTHQC